MGSLAGSLLAVACVIALFAILSYFVLQALVRRKLVCPRSKQEVEIDVLCRGFRGEGNALEVKSCTAFEDPKQVTCQQECIHTPQ